MLEQAAARLREALAKSRRSRRSRILAVISNELGTLGNAIALEGHTDNRADADSKGYGNWQLSTDRANAARRAMERFGLRPGQINAVRGYASTRLRTPMLRSTPGTAVSRSSFRTERATDRKAARPPTFTTELTARFRVRHSCRP